MATHFCTGSASLIPSFPHSKLLFNFSNFAGSLTALFSLGAFSTLPLLSVLNDLNIVTSCWALITAVCTFGISNYDTCLAS